MDDVLRSQVLGRIAAYTYAVEFQKRGLPHAHLLIIREDKIISAAQVDKIVSAELPDPATHPRLFELVSKNLTHGPCGPANPKLRCMARGSCQYKYPKPFSEYTEMPSNSVPEARQQDHHRKRFG